jgi:hypothetical protein
VLPAHRKRLNAWPTAWFGTKSSNRLTVVAVDVQRTALPSEVRPAARAGSDRRTQVAQAIVRREGSLPISAPLTKAMRLSFIVMPSSADPTSHRAVTHRHLGLSRARSGPVHKESSRAGLTPEQDQGMPTHVSVASSVDVVATHVSTAEAPPPPSP